MRQKEDKYAHGGELEKSMDRFIGACMDKDIDVGDIVEIGALLSWDTVWNRYGSEAAALDYFSDLVENGENVQRMREIAKANTL